MVLYLCFDTSSFLFYSQLLHSFLTNYYLHLVVWILWFYLIVWVIAVSWYSACTWLYWKWADICLSFLERFIIKTHYLVTWWRLLKRIIVNNIEKKTEIIVLSWIFELVWVDEGRWTLEFFLLVLILWVETTSNWKLMQV